MRKLFALLLIALSAFNTSASECFDDKDLEKLSSTSHQGTLVYVWSPRMVYSVQQMALAACAAAASGLEFVVLHDSRVPKSELYSYQSYRTTAPPSEPIKLEDEDLATPPFLPIAQTSKPLCAATLLKHDALRHFPTAFIVTAQGVHRYPIVGAMPPAAWHSSIAQRLHQP
jgi:hypothetical protein